MGCADRRGKTIFSRSFSRRPGRAGRRVMATKLKIARFLIFASKIRLALQERSRLRPGDALPLTPLATLALARRSAFGGGAFQFAALAFGRHALGGGLFAMGLGMGAEVAP